MDIPENMHVQQKWLCIKLLIMDAYFYDIVCKKRYSHIHLNIGAYFANIGSMLVTRAEM